jgi:hypothetical protein
LSLKPSKPLCNGTSGPGAAIRSLGFRSTLPLTLDREHGHGASALPREPGGGATLANDADRGCHRRWPDHRAIRLRSFSTLLSRMREYGLALNEWRSRNTQLATRMPKGIRAGQRAEQMISTFGRNDRLQRSYYTCRQDVRSNTVRSSSHSRFESPESSKDTASPRSRRRRTLTVAADRLTALSR